MTVEQMRALIILEALKTEREGLIAENEGRAHGGLSPAYGEDAFFNLADKMRELVRNPGEVKI